jgi:hypothetical protein
MRPCSINPARSNPIEIQPAVASKMRKRRVLFQTLLAIFGDLSSGICKTRIQQQQTAAAEFGTFLLKNAMAHMEIRNNNRRLSICTDD